MHCKVNQYHYVKYYKLKSYVRGVFCLWDNDLYTYNPPTVKSKQSPFAMRVLLECVFGSLIKVLESPYVQKFNLLKLIMFVK